MLTMRTLMIAAVVAALAFGGTAADAQRIGGKGKPPMPMPMPIESSFVTRTTDYRLRSHTELLCN